MERKERAQEKFAKRMERKNAPAAAPGSESDEPLAERGENEEDESPVLRDDVLA